MADETLLRQCGAGDTAAFRELFDRYEPPLMRFFLHVLGCREDAEEAVVDTFVKLWRGAPAYREEAKVRTWLYRIAKSTAIDSLRRRRRQPQVDAAVALSDDRDGRLERAPEPIDPAASLVAADRAERERKLLRGALARLDPAERTLLVLLYFEDRSYAEIAAITGTSVSRLKGLLYRARQRMKAFLAQPEGADGEEDPADDGSVSSD
jgi:RNA polymerase sigma-70 factor (ECF subfamily)